MSQGTVSVTLLNQYPSPSANDQKYSFYMKIGAAQNLLIMNQPVELTFNPIQAMPELQIDSPECKANVTLNLRSYLNRKKNELHNLMNHQGEIVARVHSQIEFKLSQS